MMKKLKNNFVVSDDMSFGRIPFEEIQFGEGTAEEPAPKETPSKENSSEEFSFDYILGDDMPFGRIPFEEIQFGQDSSEETVPEEQDTDDMPFGRIPFEEIQFARDEDEDLSVDETSPEKIRFHREAFEEVLREEESEEEAPFEQTLPEEAPFEYFFEDPADQEHKKQIWLRALIEIAIGVIIVLFVFNVVIGISQVSGDSMYPAFQEKDRILYFRLVRNFEKGDVLLIKQKDGTKLIKRVIATEGESLYIDKKTKSVYIDGVRLKEDYVYSDTEITDDSVEYPVVIEEGQVFVMGDNREASEDSRNSKIGQISKNQIKGKVFFQFRHVESE